MVPLEGMVTYLCISPAAEAIDVHSSMKAAATNSSIQVLELFTMGHTDLPSGNLALAAFHE